MPREARRRRGAWLSRFAEPESFEWDHGNRPKLRKHGVTAGETEQIFAHPYVLAGRIVEPTHDEARWLVLGPTDAGRRLAIIFPRRGDRLRPISCRPMRKDEPRIYEQSVNAKET